MVSYDLLPVFLNTPAPATAAGRYTLVAPGLKVKQVAITGFVPGAGSAISVQIGNGPWALWYSGNVFTDGHYFGLSFEAPEGDPITEGIYLSWPGSAGNQVDFFVIYADDCGRGGRLSAIPIA